ncbi:MAG: alpha/beta hydrolase [Sphingomicrobium sp.]
MRIAAIIQLLLSAQVLAQPAPPVSTSAWWRDYAEHTRMVPIGSGRTLHLLCEGSGAPTIILESGVGDGMSVWRKVQPALAQHHRACAYERAGLGLSAAGPHPRDLDAIVSDLEKLTKRAHLNPPYLLVGHSLGTFIVRLYVRRHSSQIAGLVLVDPPVEGESDRAEKIAPGMKRSTELEIERSRECASAKAQTDDCKPWIADDAPPKIAARLRSLARVHYLTQAAELEAAMSGSDDSEIVRAGVDLGQTPLIVLTSEQFKQNADMPAATRAAVQELWTTFHNEIAAHSTRGTNRVVPGTSHYIQSDRPEAVVAAVEEVAKTARQR